MMEMEEKPVERKPFGLLPGGEQTWIYTIRYGKLEAHITDFGATLVRLLVPDSKGELADVVLGFDDANEYLGSTTYFGATVGRNTNRIGKGCFVLNGRQIRLGQNDHGNNLHSGPDSYAFRVWTLVQHEENMLVLSLQSPDGDQGFPGNAELRVTYTLKQPQTLSIVYEAVSDKDTVFNLTNHSYFNLAGHDKPERAMDQILGMPARFYTVADSESIPTGELRDVAGTPMDFREPKPLRRDLDQDYESLQLQGGYDHNFEVFCNPCAMLSDPLSGRSMAVVTDCPGIQMYSGNFLRGETGKDGVSYIFRGGVALETQFYPDSVNHPEWPQPFVKAGEHYRSETKYIFK